MEFGMNKIIGLTLLGTLLFGCVGNQSNAKIQSEKMVRIANKARISGNTEASTSFFKKAIQLNEESYDAYLGLAHLYIDMKLLDAAEQYIKLAEERKAPAEQSSYLRGKIFLLQGNEKAAEKEFLKGKTYIDSMNALGAVYDGRGEHKKAQEMYKKVIAKNPTYIDAYNNIGISFLLCDQYEKAIYYLENACSLENANVMYRSNLALVYGLSGNISKARFIYSQDFEGDELEEKIAYLEEIVAKK